MGFKMFDRGVRLGTMLGKPKLAGDQLAKRIAELSHQVRVGECLARLFENNEDFRQVFLPVLTAMKADAITALSRRQDSTLNVESEREKLCVIQDIFDRVTDLIKRGQKASRELKALKEQQHGG